MADYRSYHSIKRLKLNRHPIKWVLEELHNYLVDTNLTFSFYEYLPQSFADNRTLFNLEYNLLDTGELIHLFTQSAIHQDLAFHSNIKIAGQTYHIPMIDFGGKNQHILNISSLHKLQDYWSMEFAIYDSGRSFHAYGNRLLSNEDWIKFVGSLLLLNEPNASKMIDTRWAGHRLMAGYAALRWSCNGPQYKRYPTFIGKLSELA